MKAKDFRKKAWTALNGKWGVAVLTTLIADLLGVFGYVGYGGTGTNEESSDTIQQAIYSLTESSAGSFIVAVLASFGIIVTIWSIIKLFIGGSLNLGYRKFTLNIMDGKEAKLGDLFSEVKPNFWRGFILQLLTSVYTALWSMLFIIPGIVKAYSYKMAPYILLEHPGLTPKEAITASRVLMKGNKWRLFCLEISYIGWVLLSIVTLGVGLLWVNPYMEEAEAGFYREISAEKAPIMASRNL